MPTYIRPVIIENIFWFSGPGLQNYWSVTWCHLKRSYAMFLRATVLPRSHVGIYWIWSHHGSLHPSLFHERKEFSLSVRDQGGVEQANRTPCFFFLHGPRTLAGHHSRYPNWCPTLIIDHRRCRHHVLAHRHQNWNHPHWSHMLFANRSASTTVMVMPEFFVMLLKASGLLHPRNSWNSMERLSEW